MMNVCEVPSTKENGQQGISVSKRGCARTSRAQHQGGWCACTSHKPFMRTKGCGWTCFDAVLALRHHSPKGNLSAQLCAWPLQVVWVDLLTRREFEQGFGSHTPMFSGQTKCVRYFMNFRRALELHKKMRMWGVDGTHYFAIVSCRVSHMSHVSHVCTCSCEVAHVHACMHASHAINAHVSCWPLMP
eukprot:907730-Pelagomonas_calceolata.AAC.5